MGLIRKTLAVGTLGAVNGSSKKQRVARKTLEAIKEQTTAQAQADARQVAMWRAANPEAARSLDAQRAAQATAQARYNALPRNEKKALHRAACIRRELAKPNLFPSSRRVLERELATLRTR